MVAAAAAAAAEQPELAGLDELEELDTLGQNLEAFFGALNDGDTARPGVAQDEEVNCLLTVVNWQGLHLGAWLMKSESYRAALPAFDGIQKRCVKAFDPDQIQEAAADTCCDLLGNPEEHPLTTVLPGLKRGPRSDAQGSSLLIDVI